MMRFLNSVLAGVRSASRTSEWRYKDLDTTPYLHGSEYLNELYEGASVEWQEDAVYGHMLRYDVIGKECEGYDRLARKYHARKERR